MISVSRSLYRTHPLPCILRLSHVNSTLLRYVEKIERTVCVTRLNLPINRDIRIREQLSLDIRAPPHRQRSASRYSIACRSIVVVTPYLQTRSFLSAVEEADEWPTLSSFTSSVPSVVIATRKPCKCPSERGGGNVREALAREEEVVGCDARARSGEESDQVRRRQGEGGATGSGGITTRIRDYVAKVITAYLLRAWGIRTPC